MDFANQFQHVLKLGRAPIEELKPFFEGSDNDPDNFNHKVLMDKLMDYGDPRALLVQRDLSYRTNQRDELDPHYTNWQRFFKNYNEHLAALHPNPTQIIQHSELHDLPDGTKLYVKRNSDNQPISLHWQHLPGHQSFYGVVTPEEAKTILDEFNIPYSHPH